MKARLNQWLLPLLPPLAFGFACGTKKGEPVSEVKTYIPVGNTSSTGLGVLGMGYDTDRQVFAGECVTGDVVKTGSPDSSVYFERTMSFDKLKSQLGLTMQGSYQGTVKVKASANFLKSAQSDNYSSSSIYSATYSGRSDLLIRRRLTDLGSSLNGKLDFGKVCGHEFVTQIDHGAQIYIAIKYEFSSKKETERFKAEVEASAEITKAKAVLSKASQHFTKTGKVSISAYQVGGDETKLSQIFGRQSQGYAIVKCSLDNISACDEALGNGIYYATEVFPKQLEQENGYAVTGYVTNTWNAINVTSPSPIITMETTKARNNLEEKYFELSLMQDRTSSLAEFSIPAVQKRYLIELGNRTKKGISKVVEGIAPCWDSLAATGVAKCIESVNSILASPEIAGIDRNDPMLTALEPEWVSSNHHHEIPTNALVAGNYLYPGFGFKMPLHVCRTFDRRDGNTHIGQLYIDGWRDKKICKYGFRKEAFEADAYEVLTTDKIKYRWLPSGYGIPVDPNAAIGGTDGEKHELVQYVCRISRGGHESVGKLVDKTGLCYIGVGLEEQAFTAYDVLAYDFANP